VTTEALLKQAPPAPDGVAGSTAPVAPESTGLRDATAADGKDTIGVGAVKPTAALRADMVARGKELAFDRVIQSMDGHITSTLVQMRKFQVVSGSDMNDIVQIGTKGDAGGFDPATVPAAARLKLPKYLVITSVDSFLEENATARFRDGTKTKRRFQISAQARIYDTTTGEILESSNLQVERVEVLDKEASEVTDAQRTDEMMPLLARELSEKVAWRTADVIFPAKIIDLEEKVVTINRGDTFALAVGDVMDAYAPAREVKDPDSGETIKRKGKKVGVIRITEVEPTYSQGEISEDNGVVVDSIVKKRETEAAGE
jgi:curli biogenesis system outer membrane secretion channel CsgG